MALAFRLFHWIYLFFSVSAFKSIRIILSWLEFLTSIKTLAVILLLDILLIKLHIKEMWKYLSVIILRSVFILCQFEETFLLSFIFFCWIFNVGEFQNIDMSTFELFLDFRTRWNISFHKFIFHKDFFWKLALAFRLFHWTAYYLLVLKEL